MKHQHMVQSKKSTKSLHPNIGPIVHVRGKRVVLHALAFRIGRHCASVRHFIKASEVAKRRIGFLIKNGILINIEFEK